jgi:hypothetical protein
MTLVTTTTPAYRYRSLERFDWIADIFLNKRFYAPKYSELNDPNEGYFYSLPETDKRLLEEIHEGKEQWRILSFSKKRDDVLLWAHYADKFKGICIKVVIEPCGDEVVLVNYDNFPLIFRNEAAKWTAAWSEMVFQEKAKPWKYEKEIRILTKNEYVTGPIGIKIEEVYFGVRIDPQHRRMLRHMIPVNIKCYDTRISEKTNKVVLGPRHVKDGRCRTVIYSDL